MKYVILKDSTGVYHHAIFSEGLNHKRMAEGMIRTLRWDEPPLNAEVYSAGFVYRQPFPDSNGKIESYTQGYSESLKCGPKPDDELILVF